MGSPPCREDFRRTRQPSRPGHSPDGNQTCARWQQGQDVVERGELSLPQPEAHALLPISGTWPAHRQWFCGGRLQKPHQGPHGTIGHALDRSDGRGHRQAEGHIPQRRLRSVLALPHPKRPGTPASGRQMERRRKVVTPKSFPASSGAARIDHRLICVRYSSSFIPPLPISSMSGSFQCPGAAYGASASCANPILLIDSQVSRISPVVREVFPPTSGPHFHTSARPYWHRLYKIGLPTLSSASPIIWYTACISSSL